MASFHRKHAALETSLALGAMNPAVGATRRTRAWWLLGLLLLARAQTAWADPALRVQMDVHGDFVLFGNTVAQDCATFFPAIPAPVVGTIGTCPDGNTFAPDAYWRADDPGSGQALADTSIAPADARSTAVLVLPEDANVVYARLYWGALSAASGPDTSVRVQRPSTGLDTMVSADDSAMVNDANTGRFWYQSTADVTSLVKAQGPGAYRLADIESANLVGLNDTHAVIAWYMVVLYRLGGEPSRNIAIFDGLDLVDQSVGNASASLTGFLVPNAGFDAKLGVVAYEGEAELPGDSLSFNGSTLSNGLNPANNFFNASRTFLGSAVTNAGDLPQLTGEPRSLSNVDIDVVDVTSLVQAGDSSATIAATSTIDTYLLGAFITSISTYKPDFTTSTKTVTDLNGGALRPGDELEYAIAVTNNGSDTSTNTVLTDTLPSQVTFVPGSLEIVSGANAGAKTDASGDDQAEFTPGSSTVTFRLGAGATSTQGGELAIGASSTVRFHVVVNADASGTISNQAVINARGQQGAPAENTLTDGNGVEPGSPPTTVTVDLCEADQDCANPTPFCDVSSSPKLCVACLTSAQCKDASKPDCNFTTHVCECTGGNGNCVDSDGDGLSDGAEAVLGTDPHDADSDDDGVPDGSELAPDKDSDGDGVINALDADSDNDGLFDGTELGFDCSGPGTDAARGHCRPDADMGATTTNPVARDTDGGGASDGSEDFNLDGAIDPGETDPTLGHGDDDASVKDADHDGLGDELEKHLHSDPNDADSDDDGALDGEEANPSDDVDGDKLISVLDTDSDNDGLFDGTELGKGCDRSATDASKGHCRPDSDAGATLTSPLLRDSDAGGASDGSEDSNLNGIVDGAETDPTRGHGGDDGSVVDSDGDGLSDPLEATLGTDPNDADSDDDGALDGEEANPSDDSDGDGTLNALDPDSDGDGLFDGTELGKGCGDAATDAGQGHCTADADAGATTTSPVNDDTDFGGKPDGLEDPDHNGRIDKGETDPNDPRDDKVGEACSSDADCGASDSGVVCEGDACALGCRGKNGNGCPQGLECSSTSASAGQCRMPATSMDGGLAGDGGTRLDGGAMHADAGPSQPDGGVADGGGRPGEQKPSIPTVKNGTLGGGGCDCRTLAGGGSGDLMALLPALLVLLQRRRRRR